MRLNILDDTAPSWPAIILDMAGLIFMIYAIVDTLISMIGAPTIELALTVHPTFPFIWGGFSPIGYHVMEFAVVYFMFHKKFGWRSIFMFMLVWGFEDILYNVIYLGTHSYEITSYVTLGFVKVISIEAAICIIGFWLLKPRLNLSISFIKYFGGALFVGINLYLLYYGYPSLDEAKPSLGPLLLHFASFVSMAGYLLVMYKLIDPKSKEEENHVL